MLKDRNFRVWFRCRTTEPVRPVKIKAKTKAEAITTVQTRFPGAVVGLVTLA